MTDIKFVLPEKKKVQKKKRVRTLINFEVEPDIKEAFLLKLKELGLSQSFFLKSIITQFLEAEQE